MAVTCDTVNSRVRDVLTCHNMQKGSAVRSLSDARWLLGVPDPARGPAVPISLTSRSAKPSLSPSRGRTSVPRICDSKSSSLVASARAFCCALCFSEFLLDHLFFGKYNIRIYLMDKGNNFHTGLYV